ncbi:hypothetical protein M3Y95_01250100 [Aphelenchoides besseyi]|nr:hypothetical protein M3Y95_01250100 [Aphelenchoides besseyi]
MFCFGCNASNRLSGELDEKPDSSSSFCYGNPRGKQSILRSRSQPSSSSMSSKSDELAANGVENTQITSRIVALTFPTGASDSAYRSSIKEISERLRRTAQSERYKIFNVSQKRSDLGRANAGAVVELGWPDKLAPPLDKLCSICKQIESWLNAHPQNLVVIHCKGCRARAAVVIAAYMHYATVCSNDESVADRFAMQLFSEKYMTLDGQPSHKRYVNYFANLISGNTKVNPAPIHLQTISFYQFPLNKAVLLKIYERMRPVYSSEKLVIDDAHAQLDFGDEGLSVRGDLLVKCFDLNAQDRNLLFQCQFNTCALDFQPRQSQLVFYTPELDLADACIDGQACVEFNFVPGESRSRSSSLKRHGQNSPLASRRAQSAGAENNRLSGSFSRADSYENFERAEDDRSLSLSLGEEKHRSLNSATSTQPDGADSGIGSDSPKNIKPPPHIESSRSPMPPAVPPKPKLNNNNTNDSTTEDEPPEDETAGRERSVLPAGLRSAPTRQSEENPRANAVGSQIGPDLCFSYVPAKSLKEHYRAPKKPPARRPSVERAQIEVPEDKESLKESDTLLRDFSSAASSLQRRAETPKWDEEIARIAGDLPTDSDFKRKAEEEKRRQRSYVDFSPFPDVERPQIVEQTRRAESRTKNAEMDELCDPDFYLTYSNERRSKSVAPQSTRKPFKTISQRDLDELNDIIDSNQKLPPPTGRSYTPKPNHSDHMDRDFYRSRNSRSVNALPRSAENYDPTRQAESPDDWLRNKLNTLRQKRSNEPPMTRKAERQQVELDLLEELKNTSTTQPKTPQRAPQQVVQPPKPRSQPPRSYSTQPYEFDSHVDELRRANRLNMDHTFRSRTPNYYHDNSTLDRAAAVRQRSSTPTVLMPTNVNRNVGQPRLRGRTVGLNDPMDLDFPSEQPKRPFSAQQLDWTRQTVSRPISSIESPAYQPPHILPSVTQRSQTPTQTRRQKPPTPPPTQRDRSPSPAIRNPLSGGRKPQIVLDSERQYKERLEREAQLYGLDPNSSTTPAPLAPAPAVNGVPKKPFYMQSGPTDDYRRVLPYAAPRRYNDDYSDDETERPENRIQTKSILKRNNSRDDASYGYSYGTGSTSGYNYYGGTIDSSLSSSRISNPEIYATPRHLDFERSDTPQFPVTSNGDLPFHPLLYNGAEANGKSSSQMIEQTARRGILKLKNSESEPSDEQSNSPRSMYFHGSRRSSLTSDAGEVIHHHPVFMRDTSKFWYKPTISREEAIAMLKDKEPGTFVVRDSNSFPGAFGLALKVAQPPQGVTIADGTELVRHFLIEPSPKGVKLKGCSNEPVFGTLAALVYQHSITPMALPAKLILPDFDPAETPEHLNANQALLERGAACNVTYICSLDTESLTGPEAVRRAVLFGLSQLSQRSLRAIPVHFKVSAQGITLTDNTRSLFFRRHYPVTTVTFAGIDPESRLFDNNNAFQLPSTYVRQAPMFGFVARKSPSSLENSCHVFAELDPEQPASAVVRFITNVMMVQARSQQQQIHRATAGV